MTPAARHEGPRRAPLARGRRLPRDTPGPFCWLTSDLDLQPKRVDRVLWKYAHSFGPAAGCGCLEPAYRTNIRPRSAPKVSPAHRRRPERFLVAARRRRGAARWPLLARGARARLAAALARAGRDLRRR